MKQVVFAPPCKNYPECDVLEVACKLFTNTCLFLHMCHDGEIIYMLGPYFESVFTMPPEKFFQHIRGMFKNRCKSDNNTQVQPTL